MRPVGYLQFAEDVRDVVANGVRAQNELVGDIRIALALSNQVEDLALALRQLRKRVLHRSRLRCGEEVNEPDCDGWAENGLTTANGADGPKHLGFFGVLENVSSGPCPHCCEYRGIIFKHGDDKDM